MIIYNKEGEVVLNIIPDDSSYVYREIMGDTRLMLYFSLVEYIDIPVGSWCNFNGGRYTLLKPTAVKIVHRRNYEYTLEMDAPDALLALFMFREVVYSSDTDTFGGSRRLNFSLTAKPREHLAMIVANMNLRETGGWSLGDCIDRTEVSITYSHATVRDALDQLAKECKTEYEVSGRTISLRKVEYMKDIPLSLSYGKGNGLKPNVQRLNDDDNAIGELFVVGGERNIDRSRYGSGELRLPKGQSIAFDGEHFEDEDGFDADAAKTYTVDENGFGIKRTSPVRATSNESSLDLSEIYPCKDHKILEVIQVNAEKNWYDIVIDATEDLDYRQYQIAGENPTAVFQDGMLAGREFDLETSDNETLTTSKYFKEDSFIGWRLQIVPQEADGEKMPNDVFAPVVGGIVRIFGIQLPDNYICDNVTKTGAEWEMMREAVRYMYDNEEPHYTIKADLDGIWSRMNWDAVGQYIRPGAFVAFTDPAVQAEKMLIRITSIKQYVNNPYSPEITLDNKVSGGGVSQALREIDNSRYDAERLFKESVAFSKRRFRDASETMRMLTDTVSGFGGQINPVAVQAMQLLVGSESLQFRFIASRTDMSVVDFVPLFDNSTKTLTCPQSYLQHFTIGQPKTLSDNGSRPVDYPIWTIEGLSPIVLADESKPYYLYARVKKTSYTLGNVFMLSEEPIDLEDASYYYLLAGIVNSEYAGERSFAPLYGFTEILPGRISADKIVANDTLLANGAKIGKWIHIDGKLYSSDGSIVLDADNEVILVGQRLSLTPDSLSFLKEAGSPVSSLRINADPVGNYDDIPVVLDVTKRTWHDTVQHLVDMGSLDKNLVFVASLNLGEIKEGDIIIHSGTIMTVESTVKKFYSYVPNQPDAVLECSLVVHLEPTCVVKVLRDGVSVISVNATITIVDGSYRYSIYTTDDITLPVSTDGFYSVQVEITACYSVQGSGSSFFEPTNVTYTPEIIYSVHSKGIEETLLAPDGFRSVWGDGYFFFDRDNFVVRKGVNMFKVSKDGIMISDNGGSKWNNIVDDLS